jgi:hypothetical protein
MPAGYSGTPLAKKLGIKEGHIVLALGAPAGYEELLEGLPDNVLIEKAGSAGDGDRRFDVIHAFTKERAWLEAALPTLRERIVWNGAVWASWPKRASKVPTDVTEDVVRGLALRNGLVDVKVCAVDEVWSGLKLVIPVKDRPEL